MEKLQRLKNLVKELLETEMKIAELEIEQKFAYLKPSRVVNSCDRMNAAALAFSNAAKEAPDPENEGCDIVVSNKKCAEDCAAMMKLLQNLTRSSKLKEKPDDDLTVTSFDVKMLQKLEMTVREIASSVEEDVKELQERFDRLGVDPANFSFPL